MLSVSCGTDSIVAHIALVLICRCQLKSDIYSFGVVLWEVNCASSCALDNSESLDNSEWRCVTSLGCFWGSRSSCAGDACRS